MKSRYPSAPEAQKSAWHLRQGTWLVNLILSRARVCLEVRWTSETVAVGWESPVVRHLRDMCSRGVASLRLLGEGGGGLCAGFTVGRVTGNAEDTTKLLHDDTERLHDCTTARQRDCTTVRPHHDQVFAASQLHNHTTRQPLRLHTCTAAHSGRMQSIASHNHLTTLHCTALLHYSTQHYTCTAVHSGRILPERIESVAQLLH